MSMKNMGKRILTGISLVRRYPDAELKKSDKKSISWTNSTYKNPKRCKVICSDRADQLFPGHVEDRDGGVISGHGG